MPSVVFAPPLLSALDDDDDLNFLSAQVHHKQPRKEDVSDAIDIQNQRKEIFKYT